MILENRVKELIEQKAKELEQNNEVRKIEEAKENLKKFLEKYPFRKDPSSIDTLTPEGIYNPGSGDYFFLWIGHKTRDLGGIPVYAWIYSAAVENIDEFKKLLKVIVDENKSIKEKIDYECNIRGFGSDKLIVKKILYCYFNDKLLPIFKTEHLEHFLRELNLNYEEEAMNNYKKSYEHLTIGEKFELLQRLLSEIKKQNFPELDDVLFIKALYEAFPLKAVST